YKDMQQKIEWLQAQLGDLRGKCEDTRCESSTLDPLSQKLENENMELEFQLHDMIYENAKLRDQLFDKVSEQKDITKVNGMNSRNSNQSANVSNVANQKKHKPKVKKSKKLWSKERLASPTPSKPRSCLIWSPTGRIFDLKGKIITSSESECALCYQKNDREDIGKLGAKGDIGFFIGYSANSYAYRVYNRRTKKIMETMNVTFDELSAMALNNEVQNPGFKA
ncbi:hypothetical protein Tco_1270738, partial [Tanacetum coccineum]